jgi:hypothetical protein
MRSSRLRVAPVAVPVVFVTPTFYKNKFFVQIGVHIKMHIKF